MATINSLLKFTAEELGNRIKIVKLWENASPGSTFSAQDVTINNLSDYTHLLFLARQFGSGGNFIDNITLIDKPGSLNDVASENYVEGRYRQFRAYPSSNYIHIDGCNYFSNASGGFQYVQGDNMRMMPHYIYGIKGVS